MMTSDPRRADAPRARRKGLGGVPRKGLALLYALVAAFVSVQGVPSFASANPVIASFTWSPQYPFVGELVSFVGSATDGVEPYNFSWDFGDGSTGLGASVSHTYTFADNFRVELTVTDLFGDTGLATDFVLVTDPLVADFTFDPLQPQAGERVSFSATATGGDPPRTYEWNFGDGATDAGRDVAHTYSFEGTYDVLLTVTDSLGHATTVLKPVDVTAALAADFTFSPPTPSVGESVTFVATVDGGTPTYSYDWAFGDGFTSSLGPTVSHTYVSSGSFTVSLTVRDSAGHVTNRDKPISISAELSVDFTFSPPRPQVYELVSFSATVSGGIAPYTYTWDFGDLTRGTGASVSHTYASPATYTVQLTVSDSAGHESSRSKPVPVSPALTADFSFTPMTPVIGEMVVFTASVSGGSSPYTYRWTFGDGFTDDRNPTAHAYASPGTYTVTLTVYDSAGHVVTTSHFVGVAGAFSANFIYAPEKPQVGELITFTAAASGGTEPYVFTWIFGDGATGIGAEVTHAYGAPGDFDVTLTVTDLADRTVSVLKTVTVTPVLAASFTLAPDRPITGEEVVFAAAADGGTPPYTFLWDFGDGATASGPSVIHVYTSVGFFAVNLRVSDSAGHVVNVGGGIVVTSTLVVDFSSSQANPVVAELIFFNATASGGTPPYAFLWDFGDGLTTSGERVAHSYSAPGTFTVNLTVSDSAGHSLAVARAFNVTPALVVAFTHSPEIPTVGDLVNVTGTAFGGVPPYTFTWFFGDGLGASGPSANHTYFTNGTYTLTLDVMDAVDHRGFASKVVLVRPSFFADFVFSPRNPVILELLAFTANATGGIAPYTFSWSFGDGSVDQSANVFHLYAVAGVFAVNLSARDQAGHAVNTSHTVLVTPLLTVGLSFAPSIPIMGRPVSYSAIVSGGTPPYTYNWSLGDGKSSQDAIATHQYEGYSFMATYRVALTACDSAGHCASTFTDVTLLDWPLVANLVGIAAIVVVAGYWAVRRYRQPRWQ